jgi:hypothetical protein
MSKDADKGGGRLWSGREKEQPAPEKVLPLKAPGEVRPATRPAQPHDRAYVAFEVRDHANRLHIRCATQPSRYPTYNSLLDIVHEHDFDSLFTLIYSFMTVEVTGQHLGEIVHAVSFGNCERIHEWHRKFYDPPAPGEPVIEKIVITTADEKLK